MINRKFLFGAAMLALLCVSASAQTYTRLGANQIIRTADNQPDTKAYLTVFKVVLAGAQISFGPRTYYTNSSGYLLDTDGSPGIRLRTGAQVWLYASFTNVPGINRNSSTGTQYTVPAATATQLEELIYQMTLFGAKGTILAGKASGQPGTFGPCANNETLVWDSTQTLGVKCGAGGGGGTWGSITGTLSSQTDLQAALDLKAPLASPALTGNPTAPTASGGDNDTSIATTAFVQTALGSYQPLDADLTAIAALSPSNDDIIQRKAGAWTNRTVAQFKTDLGLAAIATSGSADDLSAGTVAAARGGAGTVSGILKANGSGVVSAAAAGTDYVAPGAATGSALTMATNRLLGRTTASTGAIEEITPAATFSFSGGALEVATGGITNAMLAGSIAYGKLSLSNSIVDGDVNSSAAIGWSKISKSGSSLADLATRAITDTTGNLPITRLDTTGASSGQSPQFNGSTVVWATPAAGANPTGTIGLTAVNGSASTYLRSDAAPALSQSIAPTWTGQHIWNLSNAAAIAIGPNGNNNPTLRVKTDAPNAVTGIEVRGAAAGSGVTIAATSSGATEALKFAANGSFAGVLSLEEFGLVHLMRSDAGNSRYVSLMNDGNVFGVATVSNGGWYWSNSTANSYTTRQTGIISPAAAVIRLTNGGTGAAQLLLGTSSDTIGAQLDVRSQSTTRAAGRFQAASGASGTQSNIENRDGSGNLTAGFLVNGSLNLGVASGTTGNINLTGTTSGVVKLSVADAAGTWTMKLPTTGGTSGYFLQTDGSGNTTWAAASGGVTASSTDTFTNKTIDAEGTGNTITVSTKAYLPAASCNDISAASFFSLPSAANAPTPECVTGTNRQKGVLSFPDSDGDFYGQTETLLPADWTGTVDVKIRWYSTSATSGDVVWQVACSCVADGETDDPSFNTASTVTDTAKGTTSQMNDASITGLTITGCAAGEMMNVRVLRNRTHASDSIAGTIKLVGVEVTARRAM